MSRALPYCCTLARGGAVGDLGRKWQSLGASKKRVSNSEWQDPLNRGEPLSLLATLWSSRANRWIFSNCLEDDRVRVRGPTRFCHGSRLTRKSGIDGGNGALCARSESTAGLSAISVATQTNEISKRAASASRFLSKVHSTASDASSTDPSNKRSTAPQPES